MGEQVDFEAISEWIQRYESFVLLSHVRPDGDAIGSQIGLGFALEASGKKVRLINENGLPESLAFLRGSDRIETPPEEPIECEVVIALDTATKPRLGERALAAVAGCERLINIDHHKSNTCYGDLVSIDATSPATGQIVYQLIRALDLPLPEESRDAIYVAVSTDTGSFQYPSTTAETYQMAADLVRAGLDVGEINRRLYNCHPYRRVELMGALLDTVGLEADGRLAHCELRGEVRDRLGLRPEDSEGLIDIIRGVESVIVAIFFEELPDGKIRVSMRSKDPRADVCEIAEVFGGGGHALAAGIRMAGPIAQAKQKVIEVACRELSKFQTFPT